MSRIGKQPIVKPKNVDVKINKTTVTVKGPKGQLSETFSPDMTIKLDGDVIVIERPSDLRHHKALHGLTRALLSNMVQGVSEGFRKTLRIEGVGYQASLQGKNLQLRLGHSHDVVVEPPENVTFEVPKESRGTVIHIDGIDKQAVGQVAANVRSWRPPEPYKGKGVRYEGEYVRRKAGKAGKK
jgi:large subunit ribosomal protein L6